MPDTSIYNLYPDITPYHSDWLQVSPIHRIYYEECGNPNGKPVVFLHGGPGSGCNPGQRRFFDPDFYRIILIDQRGCGRSLPLGAIEENDTDVLVTDLDKLREHLGIDKWVIFGGSWGSTLALCYALAHREKVLGLILRGIFLSRNTELNWFLHDVRYFFPEAWEKLVNYVPPAERANITQAYAKRIFNADKEISVPAACQWNAFEASIMTLLPGKSGKDATVSDDIQLARARVQIHYILNRCFVGDRNLLKEIASLKKIPTVIVQGRYDMVCPPITAWELKMAMPHAEFHLVPDAGHSGMEPGTLSALIGATEQFKSLF